jgi:hypothetical protein
MVWGILLSAEVSIEMEELRNEKRLADMFKIQNG